VTQNCTVIVLGDAMRGDDGAALLAAKHLETAAILDCRIWRVGQLGPDDLVAALTEGPCLVLDAVRGIPPGEVVERPLAGVADAGGPQPASSHALPPGVIVRLAGALGAPLDAGTFIGIGGERFGLGDAISPAVRRGLAGYERAIARRVEAIGGATCV
jgi:hydrogenase maturation protease